MKIQLYAIAICLLALIWFAVNPAQAQNMKGGSLGWCINCGGGAPTPTPGWDYIFASDPATDPSGQSQMYWSLNGSPLVAIPQGIPGVKGDKGDKGDPGKMSGTFTCGYKLLPTVNGVNQIQLICP